MPCAAWCNAFTCDQAACITCGPSKGCSIAKYGNRGGSADRAECATWCTEYTCLQTDCKDCGREHGCEGREPPSPPSPPPIPMLPPIRGALQPGRQRPAADYFTYGAEIFTTAWLDEDGMPSRVRIRGASWFGLETETCMLGGAPSRDIESIAEWLQAQGFNAIRLPVAADAILNPINHPCLLRGDRDNLRLHNLALAALNYVEQVAEVARVAAESGLLVLLDMHVMAAGEWPDGGNIVDTTERERLAEAWEHLAEALCDPTHYWNVMAADLKNEPYTMVWNDEDARADLRWDLLATEIAQRLHNKCPRWLLFVQGVGENTCTEKEHSAACARPSAGRHQATDLAAGIWWGENLMAASSLPIRVGEAGLVKKIVFSPHTYGPATHWQKQFDSSSFPSNMERIWDAHFGYLARLQLAPVVVGEFGGIATGQDATLQQTLVRFMASRGVGGFWWSLNPESSDTGGLVKGWEALEPEQAKLSLLHELPASRVPRNAELAPALDASDDTAPARAQQPPPIHVERPRLQPPLPPSQPQAPPPPYSVLVRTPPACPSPQPFATPPVPPCSPSLWTLFGSHAPPPLLVSPPNPSSAYSLARDNDAVMADATWFIPGVVLGGWAGSAQLGILLCGCAAIRCLIRSLLRSPADGADNADEDILGDHESLTSGTATATASRQAAGHKSHWQHVPSSA